MGLASAAIFMNDCPVFVEIRQEEEGWIVTLEKLGEVDFSAFVTQFPRELRVDDPNGYEMRVRFRLRAHNLLEAIDRVRSYLDSYNRLPVEFWSSVGSGLSDPVYQISANYPNLTKMFIEPSDYTACLQLEHRKTCTANLCRLKEVVRARFAGGDTPRFAVELQPAAVKPDVFEQTLLAMTQVLAAFEDAA